MGKKSFSALANTAGNSLAPADFGVINAPTKAAATLGAKIIYNQGTGDLIYNQNGAAAGLGQGTVFATLTTSPPLASGDFRLV